MRWPFSRKNSESAVALPKLIFKSGAEFFDYQCKFGHTDIVPSRGIVALVLDARSEFGASVAVKSRGDGIQTVALRIASDDGGFLVTSETAGPGQSLLPGDVVIWVPFQYMPKVGAAFGDDRSGWVGLTVAILAAEIDPNISDFTLLGRFG